MKSSERRNSDLLDSSVLRYVVLHASRLNMLALHRKLQSMRDPEGMARLEPGEVRSQRHHRAALTLQLAAEIQLAEPDVVRWVKEDQDGLRQQLAIDAAYYPTHLWESGVVRHGFGVLRGDLAEVFEAEGRFTAYLNERTRQHGRKVPALAIVGDGAAVAEEQSLHEHAGRLAHIARSVIWMLEPSVTQQDWRIAVDSRVPSSIHTPANEVYDALLVEGHSLIDTPGQWRQPDSTYYTLGKTSELLQQLAHVQRQLMLAFGFEDVILEDAELDFELLRWLSEELRILPACPAVGSVEQAAKTLRQRLREEHHFADESMPMASRNYADAETLDEFLEGVEKSRHLLVAALQAATVVADAARRGGADVDPAKHLRNALTLLASALGFSSRPRSLMLVTLDRFFNQVVRLLPSWSPATSIDPRKTDISLEQLPDNLKTILADPGLLGIYLTGVNDDAKARFLSALEGEIPADPTAGEILAAAGKRMVYETLQLLPAQNTAADWSKALLTVLTTNGPDWLGQVALWKLGLRELSDEARHAVLAAYRQLSFVRDKEAFDALNERLNPRHHPFFQQHDAWMLVVGNAPRSYPMRLSSWRSFQMEFDPQDARSFLAVGWSLLSAFPGAVTPAFDKGVGVADRSAILSDLSRLEDPPEPTLWIRLLQTLLRRAKA